MPSSLTELPRRAFARSCARARPPALAACFLVLTAGPTGARAHVCMDAPVSRVGPSCTSASPQKVGPCGVKGRTSHVSEFRPGQTITVQLNETVDHPSHYRIAFNPNGDAFEDPTSINDKTGGHPFVLLDGIMDASAAKQSIQVTLPNVSCDKCTLQLIQVMYDKGQNGFGGNDGVAPDNDDIYYACADIVLKSAPGTNVDAGAPREDPGAQTADSGTETAPDAGVVTPGHQHSADSGSTDDPGDTAQDSGGCALAPTATSRDVGLFGLGLLAFAAARTTRRRRRGPR